MGSNKGAIDHRTNNTSKILNPEKPRRSPAHKIKNIHPTTEKKLTQSPKKKNSHHPGKVASPSAKTNVILLKEHSLGRHERVLRKGMEERDKG